MSEHRHRRHHSSSSGRRHSSRGSHHTVFGKELYEASSHASVVASICCVLAVLSGLVFAMAKWIASVGGEEPNRWLIVGAAILAGVAGCLLFYGTMLQISVGSRQVRNRLWFAAIVVMLVFGGIWQNSMAKYRALQTGEDSERPPTQEELDAGREKRQLSPEDTSLYKPGWYAESDYNGLQIRVHSFEENAQESRAFNRRILKPVSYASLSLVNKSGFDVALPSLVVFADCGTAEETASINPRPLLLERSDNNRILLQQLAVPLLLHSGEQRHDIPICLPEGFDWTKVRKLRIKLNRTEIEIAGQYLSAEQKRELLDANAKKADLPKPAAKEIRTKVAPPENANSVDWYRGL